MLLKIYLVTVILGLIAMIVTVLETKYYTTEVFESLGVDEETRKKAKLPLSKQALDWIKIILYVVTPIINITLFIALFIPNREEYVKEGIRRSAAEILKHKTD